MVGTLEPRVAPSARRRSRWITPLLIGAAMIAGIGVGVALANRNHTSPGPGSSAWCQDMTSWMSQQITNGSMTGPMMWADPDRMLSTCRAWMAANQPDPPAGWCDHMARAMRPHMNGDWPRRHERMSGPMMGG